PVPHNHHHMTLGFRGYDRCDRPGDDKGQQKNHSPHSPIIEQGAAVSSPPYESPMRTADATAIYHEPVSRNHVAHRATATVFSVAAREIESRRGWIQPR